MGSRSKGMVKHARMVTSKGRKPGYKKAKKPITFTTALNDICAKTLTQAQKNRRRRARQGRMTIRRVVIK